MMEPVAVLEFAELLGRFRHATGMTQEALAERAGISTRGISDLERGVKRRPQRETVRRLLTALDLSPQERDAFTSAARLQNDSASLARATPRNVRPLSNLPLPSTPLIGRMREVSDASALLLHPDVQLVTLTGVAGTGKTRLAIEAATQIADHFGDGVCFISLSSITDPQLVSAVVARSLGVREITDRVVMEALDRRQMLVVLDNFEQVLAASPFVANLIAMAPHLKVLITSRAPLGISAEHEFPISPFPLPGSELLASAEAFAQGEAVELFIARARSVQPNLALTRDNLDAIARICIRLDGLPLAIELAAARSKLLSPKAILSRLEKRLPLLTGGGSDLPERHQTLRGAIAWSYNLLERDTQTLFRRLSICVEGFTLEAAAVTLLAGDNSPELELAILDQLAVLVDRSLVLRKDQPDGEPRFMMLETIREFGLEQLELSGRMWHVRQVHMRYYAKLAQNVEPRLTAAGQRAWFERLESDQANLRLALAWAIEQQDDIGLAMATALIRFWDHHGHLQEGQMWLEAALSIGDSSPTALRAKAQWGVGVLSLVEGRYGRAETFLSRSLATARLAGDRSAAGLALNGLGSVALHNGEPDRAKDLREEGLILLRKIDDRDGIAASLGGPGYGA